ncbi:MAG: hypothetical protein A2Y13_06745 [Planctomycetes bacterium GWC2_45_44]|nr:MAG: hypothetical protein A2Y13_06745 [Planctomycetes bacterium GWC2_45_44]
MKRFAQGDKIWVSDFEIKKQHQSNIDDAAIITDFYTVKTIDKDEDGIIEQNFLGEIESLAGDAIDHIIKKRTFKDRPQWDILVNFTALMYVRTPLFRQIILEIYEHSANMLPKEILKDESTFNNAMQKIKDKIKPDAILSYEKALDAQKHIDITVDIPRTFYIKLMMVYASRLVPIIGKMTPHLFFVPYYTNASFVTGDVPIIAAPRKPGSTGMWIGDTNCDLYFPLSSKCCLVLNYDSLSTVIEIGKTRIAFINHLVACNCTRIVLSENQTFIWMQENRIISNNIQHLLDSWGPEKKTTPRAKIPGGNILSSCRNDWKLLTSDDKSK